MTNQYSQEIEVNVKSSQKKFQYLGIFSVLFSFGFIMLSVFISYFFMFGFGAFLILGIIFIHTYNNYPKEFMYDYSDERLVIVKKDLVNKRSRILCLLLNDIESFNRVEGLIDENDVIACNEDLNDKTYQIIYKENGIAKRLLFEPDDYLIALLNEKLK